MVATYVNAVKTQREAAKGLTRTNQGGLAYEVDAFRALRRFLILGSEGGTFYATEQKLTTDNVNAVRSALATDPIRAINEIVDVSKNGLAPKNEPALLALAIATTVDDDKVRAHAYEVLPQVARTGTHLFHFAAYAHELRGWGSGIRRAIGRWYTDRSPMSLASQVTKYQQRDGWSHRDLLRLAHPQAKGDIQNAIFKYVVDGLLTDSDHEALLYLAAVEHAKFADAKEAVHLIRTYNLPREVLPTQLLNDATVWEALLYAGQGMPMTAMIRNLGNMSKVGLLAQGSDAARFVSQRLMDAAAIRSARVHPIDIIKAKLVYQSGHSQKGSGEWAPVTSVVEALEDGFYLSFGNVEPTGKRGLLALDVSGSMTFGEAQGYGDLGRYYSASYGGGQGLSGIPGFSPRIAASVMCMVTARAERDYEIRGFTTKLVDLNISRHDSLDTVMTKTHRSDFGGTDMSMPMRYALDNGRKFDYFIVYTDNETGYTNPSDMLRTYRQKTGIHNAKLIANAMTSGKFSIADPTDPNMLDVVGFDSSAPQVMSAFIRGQI